MNIGAIRHWGALAASAVVLLGLCGCGGGGDGASSTVSGTAMAGPFLSGRVCAYKVVAGNKDAQLGCGDIVPADSSFRIDFSGYSGDIVLELSNGRYDDEADATDNVTGTPLTGVMRSIGAISNGGSAVLALTPLTETALRMAGSLDRTAVQNAATQLRALFQLDAQTDLFATQPAVIQTHALQIAYREVLRALSQMQFGSGSGAFRGDLDSYLNDLRSRMGAPGNTLATEIQTQLAAGLSAQCSLSNSVLTCTLPGGGNTGGNTGGNSAGALTCNTALFQAGAVRNATTDELTAYAKTYSGNTGSFDQNGGFTSTGNATLAFASAGTLAYNGQMQTVSSICYESAVPQLVLHFGTSGHIDLKADGSFSGVAPDGLSVLRSAASNSGGGTGGNAGFGTMAITGNAVGIQGATVPSSFTPSARGTHPTAYFSWSMPSGNSTWYLALNANTASSIANFGDWQKQVALVGLESIGVSFDMPNGKITFSNVSLPPFSTAITSGNMILNGTLDVPAATGSAVVISGAGTNAAGAGFDAPTASVNSLVIGSTTKNIYTWNGGKGISIVVDAYSNGTRSVTVSNAAGPGWRNLSAGTAVNIDTSGKTVTFNNAALSGISPTTSSISLNGVLALP
jgi:hypothetical protein